MNGKYDGGSDFYYSGKFEDGRFVGTYTMETNSNVQGSVTLDKIEVVSTDAQTTCANADDWLGTYWNCYFNNTGCDNVTGEANWY